MIDLSQLDSLCADRIDRAIEQLGGPAPTAAEFCATVNIAAADVIDDAREMFAEHTPTDRLFQILVTKRIMQACHRRAAELTASLKMGGNL